LPRKTILKTKSAAFCSRSNRDSRRSVIVAERQDIDGLSSQLSLREMSRGHPTFGRRRELSTLPVGRDNRASLRPVIGFGRTVGHGSFLGGGSLAQMSYRLIYPAVEPSGLSPIIIGVLVVLALRRRVH
jgi:hypothetical protein